MDWKKYLEEELKYYDENPEEDNDPIECHSNSSMSIDVDYSTSSWTVLTCVIFRYICLIWRVACV